MIFYESKRKCSHTSHRQRSPIGSRLDPPTASSPRKSGANHCRRRCRFLSPGEPWQQEARTLASAQLVLGMPTEEPLRMDPSAPAYRGPSFNQPWKSRNLTMSQWRMERWTGTIEPKRTQKKSTTWLLTAAFPNPPPPLFMHNNQPSYDHFKTTILPFL